MTPTKASRPPAKWVSPLTGSRSLFFLLALRTTTPPLLRLFRPIGCKGILPVTKRRFPRRTVQPRHDGSWLLDFPYVWVDENGDKGSTTFERSLETTADRKSTRLNS